MEARRCPYCRAPLETNAIVCPCCLYPVPVALREQVSEGETDASQTRRTPAPGAKEPLASPHRAGHSFGLHPEDQPYLSSMYMAAPAVDVDERSQQEQCTEPESILFPSTAEARAIKVARQRNLRRAAPSRLASRSPYYRIRKALFSLPLHSVLLTLACILVLLASGIVTFIYIELHVHDVRAASTQTRNTVGQSVGQLQLRQTECQFLSAVSGISSEQSTLLTNGESGPVTWSVQSDQSWLMASPDHGTFRSQQIVIVQVQRVNLAPALYTGYLTFTQQGKQISLRMQVTIGVSSSQSVATEPAQSVPSPVVASTPTAHSEATPTQTVVATPTQKAAATSTPAPASSTPTQTASPVQSTATAEPVATPLPANATGVPTTPASSDNSPATPVENDAR